MTNQLVIVLGIPGSGKSFYAQSYIDKGYLNLNRDKIGGTMNKLLPMLDTALKEGKNVVMDNTFATAISRTPFIGTAMIHKAEIHCIHLETSLEDAQYNVIERMIKLRGKVLSPEEIKKDSSPNIFPPHVLYSYRKKFEEPTMLEGFTSITKIPFVRKMEWNYSAPALFFDFDGTIRKTKSGELYPRTPDDIEILPGRREKLLKYKDEYRLIGISNQSGVHKGTLTEEACRACFDKTIEMLDIKDAKIDYAFCPHSSFPIECYCRKPSPGLMLQFIHKYKLNITQCLFVGDLKTDETCAKRIGMKYYDQSEFF